ncbi:MAG: hypothetical protein D6719_12415 [Candidatus Dadabacteria bacterium]|nr:MAG: hypothetical protein D6719_12415 [Candidatus Dadabacteria bacterium]
MGRPVYPYELSDPDFTWLINNFQENNPDYCPIENSILPVVFVRESKEPDSTRDLSYVGAGSSTAGPPKHVEE